MSEALVYLYGSFMVSSIMMWWFHTNLPIHLVQIIKKLGYKKQDEMFWSSPTPISLWTKVDLDTWKMNNLPAWLDELLACPGCLSMHISFWCACFITSISKNVDNPLLFFFLAWGGWPFLSNIFLLVLKKLK